MHLCPLEILGYSFLVTSLTVFAIWEMTASQNELCSSTLSLNFYLFFNFLKDCAEHFFLKCLLEFMSKTYEPGFSVSKAFSTNLNYLIDIGLLFLLEGALRVCLREKTSVSSRFSNWLTVIHNIPLFLNVCQICSDILSLILNIGHLYFLFLLICLARGLLIVLIFPKKFNVWFNWLSVSI